jgi:hypothetical protein
MRTTPQEDAMQINPNFLPTSPEELSGRPDFVYVNGDAYVDHPSFGAAIISRVLESRGFTVAMLCQPDWRSAEPFKRFGKPRLGFLVSAGNVDSMVAHYTAAKKRRSEDYYSPGCRAGLRPDPHRRPRSLPPPRRALRLLGRQRPPVHSGRQPR